MSNIITIELCAEDRARLDRLADALERRVCECTKPTEPDPVNEALAAVLGKPTQSPKNATEEAEAHTLTTEPTKEEKLTPTETAPTVAPKTITLAEVRAKVVQLSASGKKAEAREVVQAYAARVPDIPEDKLAECYERLVALEG